MYDGPVMSMKSRGNKKRRKRHARYERVTERRGMVGLEVVVVVVGGGDASVAVLGVRASALSTTIMQAKCKPFVSVAGLSSTGSCQQLLIQCFIVPVYEQDHGPSGTAAGERDGAGGAETA
jgi:hypothetical protein